MGRYNSETPVVNDSEYYDFLMKKRGVKKLTHFGTPVLYNPDVIDRAMMPTDPLIWSYGDHFYKIANQYYGNPRFWWVIAWYNGFPTEADIKLGDYIDIPVNLEDALLALGL
jgi:hypothetical protein